MRQTIFTVILIAALLTSGYVWFTYVRSAPAARPAGLADPAVAERLAQYRHLKTLKPNTEILSDPLFRSLRRSVPPPTSGAPSQPVQHGRTNPFASFE